MRCCSGWRGRPRQLLTVLTKSAPRILFASAFLRVLEFFFLVRPFLAGLESNRSAYFGSVAALWVIILVVSLCEFRSSTTTESAALRESHLSYATGSLLAVGIALLSVAGAQLRSYSDTRSFSFHVSDIYLTFWSVISHVLVAVILVSILNVIRIAASKSSHPRGVRWSLLGLLIFASLWALSIRFLENALSFEGWAAHLYAASFAAALTLLGFSVARPFLVSDGSELHAGSARQAIPLVIIATIFRGRCACAAYACGRRGLEWNHSGYVHIAFVGRPELLHFSFAACARKLFGESGLRGASFERAFV